MTRTAALLCLAALAAARLGAAGFDGFAGGARSLALGEPSAAARDGIESLFWNPAGISRSPEWSALMSQDAWPAALSWSSLGLKSPAGAWGAWGASYQWGSWPGVEERDAGGRLLGVANLQAHALELNWGLALGGDWSLGLSAGGHDALGLGSWSPRAGGGLQAAFGGLKLGAQALSLGQGTSRAQASGAWAWALESGSLEASLGGLLEGGESRASLGLEWVLLRRLALRAGWQRFFAGEPNALSLGAGLNWMQFDFDYAALFSGEAGATHRVQWVSRFSAPAPQATPTELPSPSPTPSPEPSPTATPSPEPSPRPTPQKSKTVELRFIIP